MPQQWELSVKDGDSLDHGRLEASWWDRWQRGEVNEEHFYRCSRALNPGEQLSGCGDVAGYDTVS